MAQASELEQGDKIRYTTKKGHTKEFEIVGHRDDAAFIVAIVNGVKQGKTFKIKNETLDERGFVLLNKVSEIDMSGKPSEVKISRTKKTFETYRELLNDIQAHPDLLKPLLDTGSNLYRYSFAEQIMIAHANRDATAVATYQQWNSIGCYVKRGSKSIPIPQKDGTIKNVFDISQIGQTKGAKTPVQWLVTADKEREIVKYLQDNYVFQSKGAYTFGDKIMAISESFAKEQAEDVIASLKEDALIEEADADFCNRVEKSMISIMAYSMMKRLGIDTDYYEATGRISFDSMKGMQPSILAVCGNAICAESGNVLHDIAIEVGRIERRRENGITDHLPQRGGLSDSGLRDGSAEHGTEKMGQRVPEIYGGNEASHSVHAYDVRGASAHGSRTAETGRGNGDGVNRNFENKVRSDEQASGGESGRVDDTYEPDSIRGGITDNERNHLRITSFNIGRNVQGKEPAVASQNEQIGTIMINLLQDGNAPKEVEDAFHVIFNYLDEDARGKISAVKDIFGSDSERSQETDKKEIQKAVPVLDGSSEGISVKSDSINIDISWDGVEKALNYEIEQGSFASESSMEKAKKALSADEKEVPAQEEAVKTADEIDVDLNEKTATEISGQLPEEQKKEMQEEVPEKETSQKEMPEDKQLRAKDLKVGDRIAFGNEGKEFRVEKTTLFQLHLAGEQNNLTVSKVSLDRLGFRKLDNAEKQIPDKPEATYKLYQIKDRDEYHFVEFQPYSFLKEYGVTQEDYELVYEGPLSEIPGSGTQRLDALYEKFNLYHPEDYTGHSLSVSDVIVITEQGEEKAFFVDTFGFQEDSDMFFSERKREMSLPHPSVGESRDVSEALNTDRQEKGQTAQVLPSDPQEKTVQAAQESGKKEKGRLFRIKDEHLGEGTPLQKIRWNIDAIRTLKEIENIPTIVTDEQKEILSKYVGWGGLPDIFDDRKNNWEAERKELKELLTDSEYAAARHSTLDAFYTSPVIIDAVYEKLADMGLSKGKMLEPSCGVGNFIGRMPDSLSEVKVTGVELDSITGRITKQLYPDADIQVKGFQDTSFANNTFDVAVGNVPFGELKVNDREYNKDKLLIHDYFFSKSLDKLKPNGVLAFITSKGTLDKRDSHAREILSQKADFLGAVRLPNTAFKKNAGTEVTSDIIFLRKKEVPTAEIDEGWVKTGKNENGIEMNRYFVDHPEMICGNMEMVSGRFGFESACTEDKSRPLSQQIRDALSHIKGKIDYIPDLEQEAEEGKNTIIDPDSRNYSYIIHEDKVYFKESSEECRLATDKNEMPLNNKAVERIKGMCELRDKTYHLLDLQLDEHTAEESIKEAQDDLLVSYNAFSKQYGRLNDRGNSIAFREDDSYYLLTSLEKTDDEGNFIGLADIFYKRTVEPVHEVTHCESPHDALIVSMNKSAEVNIPYMAQLCGMSEDEVIAGLVNKEIFLNPQSNRYETADEYLSGNVREKMRIAEAAAETQPELFGENVEKLRKVQPVDLTADEISARLGSTWIEPKYIEDFAKDVLKIPWRLFEKNPYTRKSIIQIEYNKKSSEWHIGGKHSYQSEQITNVYGFSKNKNALDILEAALNLKPVRIYVKDRDGNSVVDEAATKESMAKQDALKDAFKDWIFDKPERRNELVAKYNEQFNSIKPREYDGGTLQFTKMNPSIELKGHQKDAVARQVYGGNTLLAHCVGAGKTFTMAAAGMELKNLGITKKSLYVVPKPLVPQWAKEFATLYPTARVLAAKQDDFSPSNRKKMTAKIATGEYDAIIISHGQFAKIPLSNKYQIECKQRELNEVMQFLEQNAEDKGQEFSVKKAEKEKERLEQEIEQLSDIKQDNVITFEQLGVDHIFVDESHKFKNLPFHTKMQVAGINQSDTKSCKDMLYKCQYMNEKTGGKGVTFATGTPVSNSMTELYANMKYLQPDLLEELGCSHFDQWAANFGSTVTAMEFDVTGQRFRSKERFAEFFNLPELMAAFKESADVRTVDMLPDISLPQHETHVVSVEASDFQKRFVDAIAERCDKIKGDAVDPRDDNMLKVTTDGRKVAFDQRMIDPDIPENPNSKINKCVEIAMDIYEKGTPEKATQIIFADMGVPNKNGNFDAYHDIKDKLIAKGVPEREIAIIHDYDTDAKKVVLQSKMRKGDIRFLIGSTEKCGTGMNIQNKLKAAHHLDVPWRPSDIEQREGRILRQGNENKDVDIYRYVTQGTFDTYSWQIIEQKQKFVSQIMTSKSPVRAMADIDGAVLEAATAKAIACGNTKIIDKANLEKDVAKLSLAKATFTKARYSLQDAVAIKLPAEKEVATEHLVNNLADVRMLKSNNFDITDKEAFKITVAGKEYTDKKDGGEALIDYARKHSTEHENGVKCGEFKGFAIVARYDFFKHSTDIILKGKANHYTDLSSDGDGIILKLDNALKRIATHTIPQLETKISDLEQQIADAKAEMEKPFPREEELKEKEKALQQINEELLEDMKNSTCKGREEKEKAEEKPEVSQHETQHENVSRSVSDARKVEFKNLSIVEAEGGKYSLMGDVKRLNGDFENVMLTTGASREDLLKWADDNNIDIKDISTSIKGKIDHQQNLIGQKIKDTGKSATLHNGIA